MSTSYSSHIVIGVKASDLYHFSHKKVGKTKYNEDTGEPYEIYAKCLVATFGNKSLPSVEIKTEPYSYRESARQDFSFLENTGLIIQCPSYEDSEDPDYIIRTGIVGVDLTYGEVSKNGETTIEKINETIDKVKKVLAEFGYNGPIKIFSQLRFG